jgi:hypothetical protein
MGDIARPREVDARRAAVVEHGGAHLGERVDPHPIRAEACRDPVEVGVGQPTDDLRLRPVHELLAVQRHGPRLVVDHDHDDGQPVADHRVELLDVEARAAVADEQHDAALRLGDLRPDRQARRGAQVAHVAAADRPPRARLGHRHRHPRGELAAVDNERGAGVEFP